MDKKIGIAYAVGTHSYLHGGWTMSVLGTPIEAGDMIAPSGKFRVICCESSGDGKFRYYHVVDCDTPAAAFEQVKCHRMPHVTLVVDDRGEELSYAA